MDSATANALTLHGGVYSEQGSNQALQTAARMQSEQYRYQVDLAKAANYHQRDWNREYTRRQRDRLDHQRDLEREQTRRQENMARVATQAIDRFLDHREHNRTHPRVVQSSPRPRIRRD
ncbi:MAG: hypothetical protein HYV76_02885 [Candidatus Vogelbacteria bacterium]|nr:hypothetical protein [Candidatus Vogelbacteria bacterium]